MTINQAISQIDRLMHNTYSEADKIKWLSQADHMIKRHIIDKHEGGESIAFTGYDSTTPGSTMLLAKGPFDELYIRYLEAQIHYHNGEYDKYNQAILMYKASYNAFAADYNATHMPKGSGFRYF